LLVHMAENSDHIKTIDEETNQETTLDEKDSKMRLSTWRRFAFGIGGIPMQLMQNINGFFLALFLLETAELKPTYLSGILLASRIVDAVTDPITGFLVTITKSKFGQKRPWLLFSIPSWIITFFFLYFAVDWSPEGKLAFYLIINLIFQIGLTAFQVPYSSMTMVLTPNPKERDVLTACRMFSEVFAFLIGVAVFGSIIAPFRTAVKCEELSANGTVGMTTVAPISKDPEIWAYKVAAAVTCVIGTVAALICFFGTKEINTMLYEGEQEREDRSLKGFLKASRSIFTFKPYLLHMGFYLFFSLGIQFSQTNFGLYVAHTIKLSKYLNYGIICLLGAAVLFIPLGQFIQKKIGKKITMSIALCNAFIPTLVLFFLPERPHLGIFFSIMIVQAFTLSVGLLLPWSMLPDVIDAYELEIGERPESVFYSLIVFCNKLAVGVSLAISAAFLEYFGYKSSNRCGQSPIVAQALRVLGSLIPLALFIPSLLLLYYYPLGTSQLEIMRAKRER
uniref:MFS domain-containing protein n=1 Tax=Rodentolepis nana TaxID=102285 RepID=A0A0R3T7K3_RODNA